MAEARTFRGTRDFLPPELIGRRRIQEIIEKTYQRYGFQPLETPAIEYFDVLTGKSDESDKLIYKLEHKGDALGLRYDLTVPLARVVAQYKELPRPFKRYQIQPVWRADRPQLRQGRFREFVQCDADIVGTTSLLADAEIVALTNEILQALGFEGFVIRLSSRKLLRGMARLICGDEEKFFALCRCIDKLDKIGWDGVQEELSDCGFDSSVRARVMNFCGLWNEGPDWKAAESALEGVEIGLEGVREVREVYERAIQLGVESQHLKPDLTLARGLDYYTGPIFETVLPSHPHIGSLSGGGRYDGLVATFTNEQVPATGTTLGLDRIQTAMADIGLFREEPSMTDVLIAQFDADGLPAALVLASKLRKADLNVEVWYEPDRLKKQLAYADRQKIPYVIILGPDERAAGTVTVKSLMTGEQNTVNESELIGLLKSKSTMLR
jgi:histidyl-tRNA synthetase